MRSDDKAIPMRSSYHDPVDQHDAHQPNGMHHHHGFAGAEACAQKFDDPARDEWQQPERVLQALELTPTMTVAEVGAGTGYFATRLARAVPAGTVIATDAEPDMVRYMKARAVRERLLNMRAILSTADASGLAAESVDRILVVHVWHHLTDPAKNARDFAAALRPGGKLFVVDFSIGARRGPPDHLRVPPEVIVETLVAAGLTAHTIPAFVDEQYIVVAC